MRDSFGREAISWMQAKLIHGEGDLFGRRLKLLPWHRDALWRWYETDPGSPGEWWYREALFGAEAGAVKTEFLAGMAMLELGGPKVFRRRTPIITMAAASFDQAGELFRQAQFMAGGPKDAPIERAPLHGLFQVFDTEILYGDGRPGRIQRVAARAATSEGGKESLFLPDELHEWTGEKGRVYDVRAKSLTKRTPPGRVAGISTAAFGRGTIPPDPSDPLLWRLYARGLLERDDPLSRYLFSWREAPASIEGKRHDEAALRAALLAMRAPDVAWSVDVRLREILTGKLPWHEVLRYYFNRFVFMAADSWLLEIPGAWDECGVGAEAYPADGAEVVVGVDMALRGDSVGLVVAGHLSDGRVGWWAKHYAADARSGKIDHYDVFNMIVGPIAKRWRVRCVTYDPRYFELPARMLEDHGIDTMEFNQTLDELIPADGALFDLLKGHGLAHADDPVLNAHAGAAAFRLTERGRYLSKGKSAGHMDLVRAGSMATWELLAGEDGSIAGSVW